MIIGIIGAMQQEVEILRQKMTISHTFELASSVIYCGELAGKQIALLQSGIGKVAAAIGTTLLLRLTQPDYVINTGTAGGISTGLNIGDIVVSNQVAYHDVDVTAFGYQMGQLPANPNRYSADQMLVKLAQSTAEQMNYSIYCGLICSGDTFINGEKQIAQIQLHFPDVMAVEMEAAAIAQSCYAFGVPFVVVRAISDVADKASHLSFDEFLPLAAKSSSNLVIAMLEQL